MDKITLDRIQLLHPALREEANKIYADICAAMPEGVVCRFTHTLRTNAEQDALYAIGRSKPGQTVTDARGGESYHNYGLAIDFVILSNGAPIWDPKRDINKDGKSEWLAVIKIFESYGWESGYYWKKRVDPPHVQKTFGKTIAQLKAIGKQYPEI